MNHHFKENVIFTNTDEVNKQNYIPVDSSIEATKFSSKITEHPMVLWGNTKRNTSQSIQTLYSDPLQGTALPKGLRISIECRSK